MKELLVEIKKILLNQQLNSKEILNSKEASYYLGISLNSLYQLTSTGKLTHYKPTGKLIYFKKQDLDAFLLKNKIGELRSF
ncbi:helix-turn-helix domain-containing protein [Gillisia sp. JM1]|uniref:helix-turn-helix domain-containing protein n=1 Tax=Gillisia sp. JM1 TaxID=1283286 RepID=UPI00042159CE|nr:helix-turn-helix domain-containing protein [Gillisia sp. JM1]